MRRRFFADQCGGGAAAILGDPARHLAVVLRAQPGQRYELAHAGQLYLGEIVAAAPDAVHFRLLDAWAAEPAAPAPVVGVALFRFERFEWMLEKATELGVAGIVPLLTQRVAPHLGAAAPARMERWRRILKSAAEQSRRPDLPELHPVQAFDTWIQTACGTRLLLAEEGAAMPLRGLAAPPPVALLAGPEGGWMPAERQRARADGWREVSLGPRILRCETAVLAALALVG